MGRTVVDGIWVLGGSMFSHYGVLLLALPLAVSDTARVTESQPQLVLLVGRRPVLQAVCWL